MNLHQAIKESGRVIIWYSAKTGWQITNIEGLDWNDRRWERDESFVTAWTRWSQEPVYMTKKEKWAVRGIEIRTPKSRGRHHGFFSFVKRSEGPSYRAYCCEWYPRLARKCGIEGGWLRGNLFTDGLESKV